MNYSSVKSVNAFIELAKPKHHTHIKKIDRWEAGKCSN